VILRPHKKSEEAIGKSRILGSEVGRPDIGHRSTALCPITQIVSEKAFAERNLRRAAEWRLHSGVSKFVSWAQCPCFQGTCGTGFRRQSASCRSSQKFATAKTDGSVFWDQNFCIVFDARSPISLTGIDKIKYLSIIYIYIHIILLIFIIHRTNRSWLKVEVIHATKR
jgi:hypothetical protein